MIVKPSPGTVFVIEDSEDFSQMEKMGLQMPQDAQKGVGASGRIHSVTFEQQGLFPRLRNWLFAERMVRRYKVGSRVIFDKFIFSSIYLRDENGNEIKRLGSVPLDCILGEIIDD
jgi:hypothetical protein